MSTGQSIEQYAEIIRVLSLANNGYTFRRNLTPEQIERAEAAVKAGVVFKSVDIGARYLKDDRTQYWLPGTMP